MKKTIRVLSISSTAIYALSFLLLLFAILLQTVLVPAISKGYEHKFVIPAAPIMQAVCMLGLSLLAVVLAGSDKTGWWVNLLLICVAVLAITPLYGVISAAQNAMIARTQGSMGVVSLSNVNVLAGYATVLSPVAYALLLVSGGMSITYKYMSKKLQRAL